MTNLDLWLWAATLLLCAGYEAFKATRLLFKADGRKKALPPKEQAEHTICTLTAWILCAAIAVLTWLGTKAAHDPFLESANAHSAPSVRQ